MFHTLVTADLPSTERPGAAPGDDAFAQTHDEVSYGSAHLLELIRRALSNAGARDLAWIAVDDKLVFADTDEQSDDEVDKLLEQAAAAGFLGRSFDRMVLVVQHTEDDTRHVCEVEVRTRVPAGEPEMRMRIASRPIAYAAQGNETAAGFANRLLTAASQSLRVDIDRAVVQAFCGRLSASVRSAFHQSEVELGETELIIVRPGLEDLRSLSSLRFGDDMQPVRYDLAPGGRAPRWDDPFLTVMDDPYLVMRHLMFLDALLEEGHLRQPWVKVTSPEGKVLFTGDGAKMFAGSPWRRRFRVDYVEGGLDVAFANA